MAIYRPRTIGDAPEGPQRSGGRRRSDFLASRGMGEAQGKKVAATALRLRRSRRSRSSARSSHHRGPGDRVLNHKSGRRWQPSVRPGKRSLRFGEGKETKEGESVSRERNSLPQAIESRPHQCAPDAISAHRSALKKVATTSRSSSLIPHSVLGFNQAVEEQGGAGSPLMRCGCENWLRTASDCRVGIEWTGLG
jgi:hypothetical protein